MQREEVFVCHQPGFAVGAVSWIAFNFAGGLVTVRVTAQRLVNSVQVKPDRAAVPVRLEGSTATFVIARPAALLHLRARSHRARASTSDEPVLRGI